MRINDFDSRIKKINEINSKIDRVKNLKKADSTSNVSKSDKIEISEEAKKLLQRQEEITKLKENIQKEASIKESEITKEEKIRDIKAKVESGYYTNNPEVNKALTKILSDLFGIS